MRHAVLAIGLIITVSHLGGAPADEVTLSFKSPEGQTHFDQGKGFFEEKKFKEAYDAMKSARKHATDRVTKMEVERWMVGSEGGNELVELEKLDLQGESAAAHKHAEENLRKYLNTPIGEQYGKFVAELERRLFAVMEDFDTASGRYSEKFGKTFIEDPEFVRQGKRALRWEVDRENFELKVKEIPKDLKSYENGAVTFWLHFDKRSAPYQVVFYVPGKASGLRGESIDNAFIKQMKGHTGWKRIEIPLKQFIVQGDASWERVRDFRIQFQGGQKLTCHVDYIAMRK